MPGAPPNLPVPKGWKPPPGTNKPITSYVPKPSAPRPTGPGYGVLRPGVRSAPAPRPAPSFKPEPRLFGPLQNTFPRSFTSRGVGTPVHVSRQESQRAGRQFEIHEHGKGFIVEPRAGESRGQLEGRLAQARREYAPKIGLVVPGAGMLAKSWLLGTGLQQVAPGSKGLYGKLYHEGTSLLTEAPRGTVELAKNPSQGIKGIKETVTHPLSHPLYAATLGWGALHGADMIAGRVAGTPPRAPGVTGIEGSRIQHPRDYSGALSIRTAQKAIEGFKDRKGSITEREMHGAQQKYLNTTPGTPEESQAARDMQKAEAAHVQALAKGQVMPSMVASTRTVPLFGSRLRKAVVGGVTAVGKTDLSVNTAKAVADMRAARYAEFLEAHRPSKVLGDQGVKLSKKTAAAHDAVMTPMLEGYARRPETFFEDIAQRDARLKEEAGKLTDPVARERNGLLQKQLALIKDHQAQIEPHLSTHEQLSRLVGEAQDHLFNKEMLTGHLHPDQWNARLFPFGLEHGDLLAHGFPEKYANGALKYVEKPPVGDLQEKLTAAKKDLRDAEGARKDAEIKFSKAKGYAEGKKAGLPRGQKSTVSVAEHHGSLLEERRAHEMDARAKVRQLKEEQAHEIVTGKLSSDGRPWHGLYDSAGTRVDMADLKALFERETNGRLPGFLSHKDTEVPIEKVSQTGGLPGAPVRSRTGDHFLEGNYESHFGALHREFQKSARNLSAYQTKNQLMEEFGSHFVGPKEQMVELAREFNARNDAHSLAVRKALGPFKVVSRGPDRVLNSHNVVEDAYHLQAHVGNAEGRALHEVGLKDQKFTLIPERVLERIDKHQVAVKPEDIIRRGMKRMTGYNRHVALYSSARWPIGLHQEYGIRLAAINTNPMVVLGKHLSELSRAYKAGKGLVPAMQEIAGNDLRSTALDPTASPTEKLLARQNMALMDHGAMVGSEMHDLIERGGGLPHELLNDKTDWAEPFTHAVGIKQALTAWNGWKNLLGGELSRMENRVAQAQVGHQMIREYGTFSDQVKGLIKQEDKVVKEVAQDHLSPIARDKLAESLIKDVGNWGHMTPLEKELRSFWAPFSMWWLNSVKFMFRTMPMEHPLKTALWTAMVAAAPPNKLPEYKAGAITANLPWGGGPVDYNILHYSPGGIGQDPAQVATSMLLPWPAEAYERSRGVDPLFNSAIYSKEQQEGPNKAQNVLAAAELGAASFVPLGTQLAAIARGGAGPKQTGPIPLLEGKAKGNALEALAKVAFPYPYTKAAKEKEGKPERPAFKTRAFKTRAFKTPEFKTREFK